MTLYFEIFFRGTMQNSISSLGNKKFIFFAQWMCLYFISILTCSKTKTNIDNWYFFFICRKIVFIYKTLILNFFDKLKILYNYLIFSNPIKTREWYKKHYVITLISIVFRKLQFYYIRKFLSKFLMISKKYFFFVVNLS